MDRAGNWFLTSGIQDPTGGVARYYRQDAEENRLISTEITGYTVSTYVYLYKLTRNSQYLEAARRASCFLTRIAWDARHSTFPFEFNPARQRADAHTYFFDCGIIVRGLLSLWRITRDEETLGVALRCGESMAADFPIPSHGSSRHGGFYPIVGVEDKTPVELAPHWSKGPGCYQLKSAMAWEELFEETGDERFRRWYDDALAYSLETQEHFLPGSPDPSRVMDRLHPYAYFLEGLLPRLWQSECAAVLAEGLTRMGEYLRTIAPQFVRCDAYSQLLRMRLLAQTHDVVAADRLAASEEAKNLAEFQIKSLDQRVDGGFYFGRRDGQVIPHVNPVSTAFGLQALSMWDQFCQGSLQMSRQELI